MKLLAVQASLGGCLQVSPYSLGKTSKDINTGYIKPEKSWALRDDYLDDTLVAKAVGNGQMDKISMGFQAISNLPFLVTFYIMCFLLDLEPHPIHNGLLLKQLICLLLLNSKYLGKIDTFSTNVTCRTFHWGLNFLSNAWDDKSSWNDSSYLFLCKVDFYLTIIRKKNGGKDNLWFF